MFLKKTKVPPNLTESDFVLGANILLLARDLKITEYADSVTRKLLDDVDERTTVIVPPPLYESLGDIVSLIEKAGFTLVDLKTTCFGESEGVEAAAELLGVDPKALLRPEPLTVMSFRGANSIEAVNDLIQSSSFAGLGLSCPGNADEAFAYTHLFKKHSRTTATFEECSCCVIKPHAVKESLVGAIVSDVTSRGFVVSAAAMFRLERAAAAEFLEVYDGVVPQYSEMVDELCSGSVVAMEVRLKPQFCSSFADEGSSAAAVDGQEEVVDKFRSHVGPWDVAMARELHADTIRGKFGRDSIRNAVHCTDLPKDGVIESEYFFKILCSSSNYIDGWN